MCTQVWVCVGMANSSFHDVMTMYVWILHFDCLEGFAGNELVICNSAKCAKFEQLTVSYY